MTFDFFNTSALAFGSKLTSAFNQLNNKLSMAQDNLQNILDAQDIFNQYLNRNYQVPVPTRPDSACRVDEAFEVVNNAYSPNFITIKKEETDDKNSLLVNLTFFNSNTNRITHATGETELLEGYAFVKETISATDPERTIRFSSLEGDDKSSNTAQNGEILLFKFRIQDDLIYLSNETSYIEYTPYDFSQYTSLSIGDSVTLPYEAKGYECVAVRGALNNCSVKVNDTVVAAGNGNQNFRQVILYLKKGDKVDGSTDGNNYKIKYNVD